MISKNKYYLGASFRTDGSSRLASGNRWGKFWSVSGAWRIIEEEFIKPVNSLANRFKATCILWCKRNITIWLLRIYGIKWSNWWLFKSAWYQFITNSQWRSAMGDKPNLNIGLDFGLWNRCQSTIEYLHPTNQKFVWWTVQSLIQPDLEVIWWTSVKWKTKV